MNFIASAENLLPCLQLALATTDNKDPVKSLIRLDVSKGAIDLYTTTGNSGTCVTVRDAKSKTTGVVMVDASRFQKAVRECDGDINFAIKNNNLDITAGQKKYQIITVAEDKSFPFKEQVEFGVFSVALPLLREAIRLCLPAAGTIRAEDMKGATFESVKEGLRVSAIERKAAAGATSLVKCKIELKETVITSMEFCQHIVSLGVSDEEIAVGINGGTIAVSHRLGYSYFPLLHGKPIASSLIAERLALNSKPTLVSAGMFAKSVRSVLVMADKEEGNKGRLFGKKGVIEIYCHTNTAGAARDRVITAGDLSIDSWYNLRNLLDYLTKVEAEQEIRLHTVSNQTNTALVIQHGQSVYFLTNCEPPHDSEKGKD